jgi:hypothetical protein
MEKVKAKAIQSKSKLRENKVKMKEQLEHCQQLHTSLQIIRLSRDEQNKREYEVQKDKTIRLEKAKVLRRQIFRERQRAQWADIRSYRRNQEEIKAERRFHLHLELKVISSLVLVASFANYRKRILAISIQFLPKSFHYIRQVLYVVHTTFS